MKKYHLPHNYYYHLSSALVGCAAISLIEHTISYMIVHMSQGGWKSYKIHDVKKMGNEIQSLINNNRVFFIAGDSELVILDYNPKKSLDAVLDLKYS